MQASLDRPSTWYGNGTSSDVKRCFGDSARGDASVMLRDGHVIHVIHVIHDIHDIHDIPVPGCPVRQLTHEFGPVEHAFEPRGSRGVIRRGCGR